MDKIKKILTDPFLTKVWKECNNEFCFDIPTEYNVRRLLKENGLGKKLITEYADSYYFLQLVNYLVSAEEGEDYVWVDKDKLEIKECKQGKIDMYKGGIRSYIEDLLEVEGIDSESANQVMEILGIEKFDDDEVKVEWDNDDDE